MTSNPGTILGVPPGADFVEHLHAKIMELCEGNPPEFSARINVLVPSRRMQRRLKSLFESRCDSLLPKIGLVSDVTHLLRGQAPQRRISKLRRLLELKSVVERLVDVDPRLSRADVIDLTTSLANLLDEMHGEGVSFENLEKLVPEEVSGHWEQSLAFLGAIRGYVESLDSAHMDGEAAHRAEVLTLCASWSTSPPETPVIVAGSTGSRAATRLLMEAVARLPAGKVILPGFDFDLPATIWTALQEDRRFEDHPQYRFAEFLKAVGITAEDVSQITAPPNPKRNALLSLALRPAPVTDQWRKHGPALGNAELLTTDLTIMEARDPKEEALGIAYAMRAAIERGQTAALIAPEATLARRVTAELSRWGITPDDSGGMPLSLTAPGRFLRQTGAFASGQRDPVEFLALLKHPLTHSGANRGDHMRQTQEFELFLRRLGVLRVSAETVRRFIQSADHQTAWGDWLLSAVLAAEQPCPATLKSAFDHHNSVVRCFAGPDIDTTLFSGETGEKLSTLLDEFRLQGDHGVEVTYPDYVNLLERALAADSARQQVGVHPSAMIWGPLEARVQGADVVILGGLNEGVWPEQPQADPWLNRSMRRDVGLLLPERQIGLAAHDFQQAVCAGEAILSRSAQSDGAETVPSRWLSRLTNLLDGLKETGGDVALCGLKAKGDVFLRLARATDQPAERIDPAKRPAPRPPVGKRPREFAVTEIKRLIQDPYAIYARRILQLRPLDPLVPLMDARRKGTVFHEVLEHFFDPAAPFGDLQSAASRLSEIASEVLANEVPELATRVMWKSQLQSNAAWLYEGEVKRRLEGFPIAREVKGSYSVPGTSFVLRGKADRIDQLNDGRLVVYDYKTGDPPSNKDIRLFDRQLVLEAVMAEAGAFDGIPPTTVAHVVHLGVGRRPSERLTELANVNDTVTIPGELASLLADYLNLETGYLSRRAMEAVRYEGDYDHLARFGEWDASQDGKPEDVG